jgi:hypothetical protein
MKILHKIEVSDGIFSFANNNSFPSNKCELKFDIKSFEFAE